jgi:hypothetical protein
VSATDNLATLREGLRLKLRRAGSRRIVQEQFVGADQSADGSWVEKGTLEDHEADWYAEHVVTPEGTVIRDHQGPLSEHRGHGSDRPELREARDRPKRAKSRRAHRA